MNTSVRRLLSRAPWLSRALLVPYRCGVAMRHVAPTLREALIWVWRSREWTNFTYDLTPLNRRYLAAFVAEVTGVDVGTALGYLEEIDEDRGLREHIASAVRASGDRFGADLPVRLGRRVGWYAIARAVKPGVVVETGVDKGLGSCVLAAALLRNADEGHPGRYYGTDINPRAGYLLGGPYATVGEILFGDSIESLRRLDGPVDMFVNDSDHSADYEAREYATVADRLAADAVVLGDNAHVTAGLLDFAERTGRRFTFFREEPDHHWYGGGGIGAAFRSPAARATEPRERSAAVRSVTSSSADSSAAPTA